MNNLRIGVSVVEGDNECGSIQPACIDTKKVETTGSKRKVTTPTDEMNGKDEIYQMLDGDKPSLLSFITRPRWFRGAPSPRLRLPRTPVSIWSMVPPP